MSNDTTLRESYEQDKIARFVPMTVRKRRAILQSIIHEIEKKRYKSLDENNPEDLNKVTILVEDLLPETSRRTVRDYSVSSIKIWNRKKG